MFHRLSLAPERNEPKELHSTCRGLSFPTGAAQARAGSLPVTGSAEGLQMEHRQAEGPDQLAEGLVGKGEDFDLR